MHLKTATRLFFALTMLAMGAIGVIGGNFAPIWQPVPDALPGQEILAYLCILVSLACGAGLLVRRTVAPAALLLFLYLLVWTTVFKGRFIIRAPLQEVTYQSIGENAVLIAAAWMLYAEFAKASKFPAGALGLRSAYLLYGLALIAFGLSHFFYVNMTAPLVPSWLPGPVLWAYLTGAVYLATGVAIVSGVAARFGAAVSAVQITLITFLVWGPMVLAGAMSAMHWQETIVSWALTAASWVVAASFERRPWFSRLDSRMPQRRRPSGWRPAKARLRLPSRRDPSGSSDNRR